MIAAFDELIGPVLTLLQTKSGCATLTGNCRPFIFHPARVFSSLWIGVIKLINLFAKNYVEN
jgi:hypothetical protein